jgi:hypothetical protein
MAMAQEYPPPDSGNSLPQLLKELAASLGQLLRQESELARAEVSAGMHETQRAGRWFAIALVPAAVGLVLIALAIAYALAAYMPMWLAALIPGIVLLAAAGAFAFAGKRRMSHAAGSLKPEQTAESLREDKRFLSEQLGELKSSVTGGT